MKFHSLTTKNNDCKVLSQKKNKKKYKCSICYSTNKDKYKPFTFLPLCKCNFCNECLTDWVLEQLNHFQDYTNALIRCPQSSCSKTYSVEDFTKILKPQQKSRINDLLAKKYCQASKDILNCPNKDCQNYGYIEHEICNKSLICPICKREWDEYSLYSNSKKLVRTLKNILYQKNEFSSICCKAILTKKCPSCKVNILKNKGCSHINCIKCNFDFCWKCNQKWSIHSADLCEVTEIALFSIFFMIILLLLHKIQFLQLWKYFFINYGIYFLKYFMFNTSFLISLAFHWDNISFFFTNKTSQIYTKILSWICIFSYSAPVIYNYVNSLIFIYEQKVLLPNIVIGIIEVLIFSFSTRLEKNWIRNVI